jgi:hypothetical protein
MVTSKLVLGSTLLLLSLAVFSVNLYAQGKSVEPVAAQPASTASSPPPPVEIGKTGENLKGFFTVLVYPSLVIGVFLVLLGSIFYVTTFVSGTQPKERLRNNAPPKSDN